MNVPHRFDIVLQGCPLDMTIPLNGARALVLTGIGDTVLEVTGTNTTPLLFEIEHKVAFSIVQADVAPEDILRDIYEAVRLQMSGHLETLIARASNYPELNQIVIACRQPIVTLPNDDPKARKIGLNTFTYLSMTARKGESVVEPKPNPWNEPFEVRFPYTSGEAYPQTWTLVTSTPKVPRSEWVTRNLRDLLPQGVA